MLNNKMALDKVTGQTAAVTSLDEVYVAVVLPANVSGKSNLIHIPNAHENDIAHQSITSL
jgi:hypothetical protein